MSALERVLVDEHLHLALQPNRYAHRVQQLQTGAVHLHVDLRALQADLHLPVGCADQPPTAARLEHPDLQLAVADPPALQLGALETVDIAQSQRHYSLPALFAAQLLSYLLLVALFVLEHDCQNASARLE